MEDLKETYNSALEMFIWMLAGGLGFAAIIGIPIYIIKLITEL